MIRRQVVIIFPKDDVYTYKSDIHQMSMKEIITRELDKYFSRDLSLAIIAEDKLAKMFMDKYEHSTYSSLTIFDRKLLSKYDDTYGYLETEFTSQQLTACDTELIKKANKICKAKTTDNTVITPDDSVAVVKQRIRYTVSELLKLNGTYVLYFDRNHDYCSLSKSVIGDNRHIHKVDLITGISEYWYTGMNLDEETYFKVLEAELS